MSKELGIAVARLIDQSIFNSLSSVYNIAFGYFQRYSASSPIPDDERSFIDVKLHYKEFNNKDISLVQVPLVYIGSKNAVFDYKLESGDQVIVFFADRTLEQWKDSDEPQLLSNTVKDSKNHCFALPIMTHRDIDQLNVEKNDNVKLAVSSGKKLQLGLLDATPANRKELLDILYQLMEILLLPDTGGYDYTGKTSGKGKSISQLKADLAIIADVS
jgi:hypothetical protein